MTAKEQKMYQNVEKWRGLSKADQRHIAHASAVKRVANSMAMEGEPVSKSWLKQNSR